MARFWCMLAVSWVIGMMIDGSLGKVTYDGYELLRVQINDMLDVEWLQGIADDDSRKADVWSYPTRNNPYMDILVSPAFLPTFQKLLKSSNMNHRIMMRDVGHQISHSEKISGRARRHAVAVRHRTNVAPPFPFDDYHSFDEIESWLRHLSRSHPNRVHLSSMGTTAEGRQLWVVKISSSNSNVQVQRPAVFIDAGLHAREWISHATALYMIRELIHNMSRESYLANIDWYIVPVANPDGYEYSKTTDRLWRKSRSAYNRARPTLHSICKGVDINRNFDYHWGETGANTMNPCSNIYAGPHAFSETETEALAKKLRQLAPSLKAYVSLHSYGQLWLVPWGYHSAKPANYPHQSRMALKAMEALRRFNQTEYTFGTIADLMYPASGTSVDYAHSLGIPFTFALELRPEDSDHSYGFLYPAEYILPTGKETFEAFKELAKEINNTYGSNA